MAITQETLLLSDHPSPRSRRSRQPLLNVGAWINGRYLLQGIVGKGGMSTVFKALDTQTDRRVAIKIPLPKMFNVDGLHQRFAFEHAVTRTLSGPHSVHVFDHGVHHHQARKNTCGLPWIAMELLHGESLRTRLKRHGRFSLHQAVDILIPMLKGLRHAHCNGIIHRDLKPDNIFLVSAGDRRVVKIIDYGIALVKPGLWTGPSPPSSQGRRVIGTPAYMAPEQCLSRRPLTHAIDIYAVGCIAYRMLSGQLPFNAKTLKSIATAHTNEPTPQLKGALAHTPIGMWVRKAMSKAPRKRFATVDHMLTALNQISLTRTAHDPSRQPLQARCTPVSHMNCRPQAVAG